MCLHFYFCYRPKELVADASKERPIPNRSKFGARKTLLTAKAYLKNMGGPILKFIIRQSGLETSFIIKGRERVGVGG